MSLAVEKVPVTLVENPVTSFPRFSLPARIGGSSVEYCQSVATSTNGSIQFQFQFGDPMGSVLAQSMIWYNDVSFTINLGAGNGGAGPIFNSGVTDALRAFPITSCVDTMSLTLNGKTFTVTNQKETGHILRRFNSKGLYKHCNWSPWFPDSGCANYTDLIGTARNPLAAGSGNDMDFMRGAYQQVTYTPTAGATAYSGTVNIKTWEPFNLSPLMYDQKAQGLPYINRMQMAFNISNGSWCRALSHAVLGQATVAIPNTAVQAVVNNSIMYYQTIGIPSFATGLGPIVQIPYYELNTMSNNSQLCQAGVPALSQDPATLASTKYQSQILSYGVIPNRIYIAVQPDQLTAQDPDFTFMYTGGITVKWNGKAYLTEITREQIYGQLVDAGYGFAWENFNGSYVIGARTQAGAAVAQGVIPSSGSIICIRPGIDFPLPPGQACGMPIPSTFQFTGNFHDQRAGGNVQASLWVIAVQQGLLTITSENTAETMLGVISQTDVLDGSEAHVPENEVYNSYGSGWFDTIKNALPMLQQGARYAHAGLSAAKDAGILGGSSLSGGASFYGGSSLSGGALLTKSALRQRMR